MDVIFKGAENMLLIFVIACIIVFASMCVDLISGLYKAKLRGEIRSSFGLKRSLGKFIMYMGGMLIACGVDVLMHLCKFFQIIHVDALFGIPVFTCLLGVFLPIVEFLSVREKADQKTKTEISRVEKLAAQMVKKDDLVDALTQALTSAIKKES